MFKATTTAFAAITALTLLSSAAPAAPIGNAPAIGNAAPAQTETVRYRGRRGGGWGGAAAGFAAGAILGGIIASQAPRPYYYYEPGPYYYGPTYYYPGPYYGAYPGDPVAYCMRRFRSYDPVSGTYMGYDGFRHPCP